MKFRIFVFIAFAALPPLTAQEAPALKDSFFFNAAAHSRIVGDLSAEPLFGFHLGGGALFRLGPGHLSLGVEAGLTFNEKFFPILPLTLSAGYRIPLKSGFSLNPGIAGGGILFAVRNVAGFEFFFGPRLYAEYRFGKSASRTALSVYAGGGLDILTEKTGPIFMPKIALGLRVYIQTQEKAKPQALPSSAPAEPATPEALNPEKEPELPPEKPLALIYFAENSAEPLARYQKAFNAAALYLEQNPTARLVIRGYADAAEPDEAAQERARACAAILVQQYGIAENRLQIEYFGSRKLPFGGSEANPLSRRAVEFVKRSGEAQNKSPGSVGPDRPIP